MSDLIKFPFVRKTYGMTEEPISVGDIKAANQILLSGLINLAGFIEGDYTFVILSGLNLNRFGNYSAGVAMLYSKLVYCTGIIGGGGHYMVNQDTDIEPQLFGDSVTRNTYTLNQGIDTTDSSSASPEFIGDMNVYRIGNSFIKNQLLTDEGLLSDLSSDVLHLSGATLQEQPARLREFTTPNNLGDADSPLNVSWSGTIKDNIYWKDQFGRVRVQGRLKWNSPTQTFAWPWAVEIFTFSANYIWNRPEDMDYLFFWMFDYNNGNVIKCRMRKSTGRVQVEEGTLTENNYYYFEFAFTKDN